MNLMHEDLARAQMAERLGEAQTAAARAPARPARRLSRRAERAALQARLALARVALSTVDATRPRPPGDPPRVARRVPSRAVGA